MRTQFTLARVLALASLWAAAQAGQAHAQARSPAQAQSLELHASLADLSLEELGSLAVTSVSGRPQSLRSAAASIYVITGEDIRRSAARSLPEALRLAPNLHVARINANHWAISARGFNTTIPNKLLVLVDGRTIYSTLFAGVFWDFHDVMLEDVERIEVISGPGGTLWGANAVNGVINVVTKPALATQGPLVSAMRSDSDGQAEARLGMRAGPGHLRLYAMHTDRAGTRDLAGNALADETDRRQVGFRGDWDFGAQGRLTLQGDAFEGGPEASNNMASKISGGNLGGRYDSRMRDGSPWRVQLFLDRARRDDTNVFRNTSGTADLQFVHEPHRLGAHQWVWGGGYKRGDDENQPSPFVAFVPAARTLHWWNVFAQDQVQLDPRTELTVGLKAERNSYTGVEWLPTLRLARRHDAGGTSWGAVSRAVRAPSRIDREFFFPGQAPFIIVGGSNFESEVANVFELGHRGSLGRRLNYDVTVFRHRYSGLRAGGDVLPTQVENRVEGWAQGLEAWTTWSALPQWRLSAGYTRLHKKLHFSGGTPSNADLSIANLGNDPQQQWKLRSRLDLGRQWAFDVDVRHVGRLPRPAIESYTAVDARLAWNLRPDLELSLVGQNLFDPDHAEFETATGSQVPRQVWLKLVWQP